MAAEIPLTSREVATQTYQEYVTNPNQFMRGIARQLEQTNHRFLDAQLSGGVTIAVLEHPEPAQRMVGGNLYRYACSDREMQKTGDQVPDLTTSFPRTLDEVARLTEAAFRTGHRIGVIAKQMTMRIEREDPEIGRILRDLVELPIATFRIADVEPFIQGVHNTHLHFRFIGTSVASPELVAQPAPSSLPLVRRSIVRTALLETILNRNQFVYQTLKEANQYTPEMVKRIAAVAHGSNPGSEYYLLLASFTIFCLLQEFQQRQQPLPTILEGEQIKHPDPEIGRLIQAGEDSKRLDELLAKYRNTILYEIGKTNPHLFWGIYRFFEPLYTMIDPAMMFAAVNGVVNQYSTLKTASKR